MQITSAQITLGGQYKFAQKTTRQEELVTGYVANGEVWNEEKLRSGAIFKTSNTDRTFPLPRDLSRELPREPKLYSEILANSAARARGNTDVATTEKAKPIDSDDQNNIDPRLMVLVRMIKIITGKKIKIQSIETANLDPGQVPETSNPVTSGNSQPDANWGLRYHYESTKQVSESFTFNAQGIIKVQDGREITLSLELNMSREYIEHEQIDIREGAAKLKDPLVINFNGAAAKFDNKTFDFDLDADGSTEKLRQLAATSGLLGLDKNGDNKINNGSELFGALNGDGFADIAQYDSNHDKFIDEQDPVWEKIRIWVSPADNNGSLLTLKQANIGGLYLGYLDTPFELRNEQNELTGIAQKTSVYVTEDGQAGTTQHVDMVVF